MGRESRKKKKKEEGIKKKKIVREKQSIAERQRKALRGAARQTGKNSKQKRVCVCVCVCVCVFVRTPVNLSALPAGVCVQIIQSAAH